MVAEKDDKCKKIVYQFGFRLTLAEAWWSKSREEPWRAKSSVNPPKKIKSELAGYKGSTQFSEQGPLPCSFFVLSPTRCPADFLGWPTCTFSVRV
jgi:hypothetical protein